MKEEAIILRRSGLSYTDISNKLGVSKALLSKWLKNYRLTPEEKVNLDKNIKDRMEKGRMKAKISIRSRMLINDRKIHDDSLRDFEIMIKEPFFTFGLALYEGHGGKKGNYYSFTHSDPEIHLLMIKWLLKYAKIDIERLKLRIFISNLDNVIDFTDFWSNHLNIPEERITSTVYKRGSSISKSTTEFKGIVSVMYTDVVLVRKIYAWQKHLLKYYRDL